MTTSTADPDADAGALIVCDEATDNAPSRDLVRLPDRTQRDDARAARFTHIVIGDDNHAVGGIVVDGVPIPGIVLTRTALVAADKLPRELLLEALGRLERVEQGAQWWVGDLLVVYADHYGGIKAIKAGGYSYGARRTLRSVAERVPPERRRPDLTWGHHAVVARLHEHPEEQVEWLAKAAGGGAKGWTVAELRRRIRERHPSRPKEFPSAERTGGRCPTCGHEWGDR
jgi:hypothetical protein